MLGLNLFGESDESVIDITADRIDPKSPKDLQKLSDNMEEILIAFGWDMEDPSVENTPLRFLKYLAEFHTPFEVADVLGTPFKSDKTAMVIQRNIPFRGVCEHHLLPMFGFAYLGYVPDGKVIGLSKMARLIEAVGVERPSLQEHICDKVADTFNDYLKPKGVMVVIDSYHTCMACRGVNVPNVPTTTSSTRGCFFTDTKAREEFMQLALRSGI